MNIVNGKLEYHFANGYSIHLISQEGGGVNWKELIITSPSGDQYFSEDMDQSSALALQDYVSNLGGNHVRH